MGNLALHFIATGFSVLINALDEDKMSCQTNALVHALQFQSCKVYMVSIEMLHKECYKEDVRYRK